MPFIKLLRLCRTEQSGRRKSRVFRRPERTERWRPARQPRPSFILLSWPVQCEHGSRPCREVTDVNPFDLPGPEFLLFYIILAVAVITALALLRRAAESDSAPQVDLGDPYLIAYLRGGENEAPRVALVSLID